MSSFNADGAEDKGMIGSVDTVNIVSNGTIFTVDRRTLEAESPVFKAMFESSMIEQRTREIVVEDFDYEVVGLLLTALCSHSIPPSLPIDDRIKLLTIAEKYRCVNVQILCEETFINELNDETAIMYLQLAEFLHCDKLLKSAIAYVTLHCGTVQNFTSMSKLVSGETSQLVMNAMRSRVVDLNKTKLEVNQSLAELLSLTTLQYSHTEKLHSYSTIQDAIREIIHGLH